ncbi:GNAT family N-acetyltransferase [Gryllotalpicola reticulitermitis]|uniref:GNAT family N-acetyltransferase n=1 Tax=Gryllotalpicola reticulitermitis TaxID=1184153 RepID=A0ABV8QC10_9MICO
MIAYADVGDVAIVDDTDTMHVWILVHPDRSRRGLGTSLLQHALEFARAHGRSSLVTAVDRTDKASERWLVKNGFHPAGDLDIRRRQPRESADLLESGHVDVLPTAAFGESPEFLEIAARGTASRPLPDGTRVVVSPDEVREWYFSPTSAGRVYTVTRNKQLVAFASVQPARTAGYSVEPIWAKDSDPALTRALLREIVRDADTAGHELVIGLSPLGESGLDEAVSLYGFESVGGRVTWRRAS